MKLVLWIRGDATQKEIDELIDTIQDRSDIVSSIQKFRTSVKELL